METGTSESVTRTKDAAREDTAGEEPPPQLSSIVLDPAIVSESWKTIQSFLPEGYTAGDAIAPDDGDNKNAKPARQEERERDEEPESGKLKRKTMNEAWAEIRANVVRIHQARGIDFSSETTQQQTTQNDYRSKPGAVHSTTAATSSPKLCTHTADAKGTVYHPERINRKRKSNVINFHRRRRLVEHWIDKHRDCASEPQGDVCDVGEISVATGDRRVSVGSDVEVGRELGSPLSMLDIAERAVARPPRGLGEVSQSSMRSAGKGSIQLGDRRREK